MNLCSCSHIWYFFFFCFSESIHDDTKDKADNTIEHDRHIEDFDGCVVCANCSLYIFFRLIISRQAVGRCDCNIGQSINQIIHTTNLCRPDTVPIKCPSGSWKLKFSIRLDTTRWLTDSYVFPPNQGSWQLETGLI